MSMPIVLPMSMPGAVRGNEPNSYLRRTTIPGAVKSRESPGGAGVFPT